MKNLFETNFDNCFQNDRNRLRLSTSYEWLNLGEYYAHTHKHIHTLSHTQTDIQAHKLLKLYCKIVFEVEVKEWLRWKKKMRKISKDEDI
jgi:hypothetical protein